MKIEVGKVYETRDGKLVRVICTDRKFPGGRPVLALVTEEGQEWIHAYSVEGGHSCDDNYNLIREHVPVTYRWSCVFDDRVVRIAHSIKPELHPSCVGLIKLAFDPSGNLIPDKCEITGAQPNG